MSTTRRWTVGRWTSLVALLLASTVAGRAVAEAKVTLTYDPDVVWSTVVRLLRVDLGYEIAEQDRDNGYLLFVVAENGRTYNGSLELVLGTGEQDLPVVDLALSITGLPQGAEENILRKLRNKLRDDYGLPPRVPAAPPPETAPPVPEDGETGEPSATSDGPTADEP